MSVDLGSANVRIAGGGRNVCLEMSNGCFNAVLPMLATADIHGPLPHLSLALKRDKILEALEVIPNWLGPQIGGPHIDVRKQGFRRNTGTACDARHDRSTQRANESGVIYLSERRTDVEWIDTRSSTYVEVKRNGVLDLYGSTMAVMIPAVPQAN